jgi:VWFA-related protein
MRLLPILLLALAAPDEPQATFRREVQVSRVVVDARVIDNRGEVIPDLGAADFEALVDGNPAEVESAEWLPAGQSEFSNAEPGTGSAIAPVAAPPGRLIVLFFQSNFTESRLTGFVRMAHNAKTLLDTFLPTDRVAVVSFDSHLKLHLDFTDDRARLEAAIQKAIRVGTPGDVVVSQFPSLARHFDFAAARRASTVEKGLALTARALAPIPGTKTLLFFGWGLYVNRRANEAVDYGEAIEAIREARLSVFSLDVTDAESTKYGEAQLQTIADLTGGSYQKTNEFPRLALQRVAKQISGRYVVVVVAPMGKSGTHDLELRLASRKGRVFCRSSFGD